jgi:hypothetical protein
MSQPQRRLPASVYWRRRLVVFGGLLAVIAVIVLIIVRPGFGVNSGPTQEETEAMTEEPTIGNCLPSQIELVARTDQNTYGSGMNPQLWMGIRNISTVDCIVDVGTDVQRYEISSGPDLIWSSSHCQTDSVPFEVTLLAGSEQETAGIPWDRTRSSVDACAATASRPVMPGGGASYHLRVYLGDLESAETRQFLLN